MDPCFATATQIARAIRSGKLSSFEATEAHLERIARLNGPINALVIVDRDGARKAARAADRALSRKGGTFGLLHGVPITIKEAFDVAGLATTASHPPLRDNVATADASSVARLRAAGAVILGKTNVPELCMDFQCNSPVYGETRNPWDVTRGPGGSTGGGGAAVAARFTPLELGSDIGGSIRNPAHFNGVFGLKSTEWRVPARGHVPDLPGQTRTVRFMGTFGPLARSVADLELSLRLISGPDGHEAEAAPVPIGPTPAFAPQELRIAVLESNALMPASADTRAVVQATAKLLAKAGMKVKAAQPEGLDWERAWDDWSDLYQYENRALQPLVERERFFANTESPDPSRRSVARAARLDMGAFFSLLARRDEDIRRCEALLDIYDAWLMPVVATPAFTRQKSGAPIPVDGVDRHYFRTGTAYTFLGNFTGQPSIVLPCGFSREGLPIGLQLTGKRWGEAKLLGVAKAVEKLLPPCAVPPAFAV